MPFLLKGSGQLYNCSNHLLSLINIYETKMCFYFCFQVWRSDSSLNLLIQYICVSTFWVIRIHFLFTKACVDLEIRAWLPDIILTVIKVIICLNINIIVFCRFNSTSYGSKLLISLFNTSQMEIYKGRFNLLIYYVVYIWTQIT